MRRSAPQHAAKEGRWGLVTWTWSRLFLWELLFVVSGNGVFGSAMDAHSSIETPLSSTHHHSIHYSIREEYQQHSHDENMNHSEWTHHHLMGILSRKWKQNLPLVERRLSNNNDNNKNDKNDWDEVNSLLSGITLQLPDVKNTKAEKFLGKDLMVDLTNASCTDISLSAIDASTHFVPTSNQPFTRYRVDIDISGMDIQCKADWAYRWSSPVGAQVKGSGKDALLTSEGNSVSIYLTFSTSDSNDAANDNGDDEQQVRNFDTSPPLSVQVSECQANVKINTIHIPKKDVVSTVFDLFETFFRGTVAEQIQNAACDEIMKLADSKGILNHWLHRVANQLDHYLDHDNETEQTNGDGATNGQQTLDYFKLEEDILAAAAASTVTATHAPSDILTDDTTAHSSSDGAIVVNDDSSMDKNDIPPPLLIQWNDLFWGQRQGQDDNNNINNHNDDDDTHTIQLPEFVRKEWNKFYKQVTTPIDDKNEDLGINPFLRSTLLDLTDNASLTIPLSAWTAVDETIHDNDNIAGVVYYQTDDGITRTTIQLNQVKIIGLDKFTKFQPFVYSSMGRYTLENSFAWSSLSFELELIVKVLRGDDDNRNEDSHDDDDIVERILVTVGANDINAKIDVLLGVDYNKLLTNAMLGNFLDTDKIIRCLLQNSVRAVKVTNLDINVASLHRPVVKGFTMSQGMEHILSTSVDAIYDMYQSTVVLALPTFFRTTGKDSLDSIIRKFLMQVDDQDSNSNGEKCLHGSVLDDTYVDFRDLFLSPDEALAAGGSGTSPYGNVVYSIRQVLLKELGHYVSTDNDGDNDEGAVLSKLNTLLVQPLTVSQSGTEGMLRLDSDVFKLGKTRNDGDGSFHLVDHVQFTASDVRVENLDTLSRSPPIHFLEPNDSNPHLFSNGASFGSNSAPANSMNASSADLTASVRFLLEIQDDNDIDDDIENLRKSLFAMRNILDLTASSPHSDFLVELFAKLNDEKFMNFPVQDLLNFHCWLAAVPTPALDENGIEVDSSAAGASAALNQLLITIDTLSIDLHCVQCSSEKLYQLPGVLDTLKAGTDASMGLKDGLIMITKEILEGQWMQTNIDRLLAEAPQQCPHDPLYDASYSPVHYKPAPLPNLSRDSVEFVFYASAVVLQTAAVIVAETYVVMDDNISRDPLSPQQNLELQASDGIRLVDMSDLTKSLGGWAHTALAGLRDMLSNLRNDPNGPNSETTGKDLGINIMLRSFLLNEDRSLIIGIDDLSISVAGVTIEVIKARITGLDTFKSIDALDVIGSQTLKNKFGLEKLNIEIDALVNMEDDDAEAESVTLRFGFSDLDVNLGLLLAMDQDILGDIRLGSLLHSDKIVNCLISAIHKFEVTELSVSVDDIEKPAFDGFVSDQVKSKISEVTDIMFDKYKPVMVQSIPNIFNLLLLPVANRFIFAHRERQISVPCPKMETSDSEFLNFGDLLSTEQNALLVGGTGTSPYGDVFRTLKKLLEDEVLQTSAPDGRAKAADAIIAPVTKAQSNVPGTLYFPGAFFEEKGKIDVGGLRANYDFVFSNLKFEHLDSLGQPLELLDPVDPYTLNNTATFGVGPEPVGGSIRVSLAYKTNNNVNAKNVMDVSLNLKAVQVLLMSHLQVLEKELTNFPLRDISNLHCWLAMIPAPQLDKYGVRVDGSTLHASVKSVALTFSDFVLTVKCIECQSPGFEELSKLLSSPEGANDATELVRFMIDYIESRIGGKYLQIQIDRALHEASLKCPHSPAFDKHISNVKYKPFELHINDNGSFGFVFAILFICFALSWIVAVIVIALKRIVKERHRRFLLSLSPEDMAVFCAEQLLEEEKENMLNQKTSAMFFDKTVPSLVRWLMPVIIIANIAFFLSGHLSLGATVNVVANLAGQEVTINKLFEFSLAKSTIQMWQAGAKQLAILILIFSGIWPYTKQLITLIMWFMPPTRVSVSQRENIFLWLDALAKWSMIDIFVLFITVAAFRISVYSPTEFAFLPEDFYSVELMVVPLWGLYANMIAQLVTQISSHFIVHYHRQIVAAACDGKYPTNSQQSINHYDQNCEENDEAVKHERQYEGMMSENGLELSSKQTNENPEDEVSNNDGGLSLNILTSFCEDREALCDHHFRRGVHKQGMAMKLRRWVNFGVILVGILLSILIIWGCSATTFSLDILGVVGVAIEAGQRFKKAVTKHSVFSMANVLLDEGLLLRSAPNILGLGILSTLLISTTLVVPLMQVALLLYRWFKKLNAELRFRSFVLLEILQAWQYIEVYILSIMIACWQLAPVSDFMINAYCGSLRNTFASLAFYGVLDDRNAQCFRVQAEIESASWVLFIAAIILAGFNHFVSSAASQQVTDCEKPVKEIQFSVEDDDCLPVVTSKNAHLAPLRFTDYYRWMLLCVFENDVISNSIDSCAMPPNYSECSTIDDSHYIC